MFFQGFQPQHVGLCVQEHVQFWFVFILKYIDQRLCVITLTPIGFTWMGSFWYRDGSHHAFQIAVFCLCFCAIVGLLVCLFICLSVSLFVLLFGFFIVLLLYCYIVFLFVLLLCCLLFVLLFVSLFVLLFVQRTHTPMILSTCKIDQREDKVRKQARSRRMCTLCRWLLQRDLRSRVALISVIGINVSGSSFASVLQASAPWRRELLSELTKDKPMISHIAANSHPKTSYS